MKISMVKAVSFGERSANKKKANPLTKKTSLIDGRPLRKNEILNDIYEFCKQQKEQRVPLYFDIAEKLRILNADIPMETLIEIVNQKSGLEKF